MDLEPSKNYLKEITKYLVVVMFVVASVLVLSNYLSERTIEKANKAQEHLRIKTEGYGISETIRAVKAELYKAQTEMLEKKEEALFKAESFDLELNFIVRSSGEIGSEVSPKFFVVSDKSHYGAERVQKIKLHFSVVPDRKETGTVGEAVGDINYDEIKDLTPEIPLPQRKEND